MTENESNKPYILAYSSLPMCGSCASIMLDNLILENKTIIHYLICTNAECLQSGTKFRVKCIPIDCEEV